MIQLVVVVFLGFVAACTGSGYERHYKAEETIVQTTYGPIQGQGKETVWKGNRYAAYKGIPFAEPPIGDLRFKAPVPHAPWTEVLNATEESPGCESPLVEFITSEDCLFLNVYTPVFPDDPVVEPKAVMVWIYGGGFAIGATWGFVYSPDFYIDNNVIFVSMNYRLGSLGFLSLQNEDVPGNAGLKDQALALKWVNDNIANFGGDVNRITVFGESAGGASVGHMMLSKLTEGLFSGLILESGTALNEWAYTPPTTAVEYAFALGDSFGCGVNKTDPNSEQLLSECLRSIPARDLVRNPNGNVTDEEGNEINISFSPTSEPAFEGSFINQAPIDIINSGEFHKVPTILGENSRESLILWPVIIRDETGETLFEIGLNLTDFIPADLQDGLDPALAQQMEGMIRDFYFDGGNITIDKRLDYVDLTTTTEFSIGVQKTVLLLAQLSTAPIYSYHFTYDGPFNLVKTLFLIEGVEGACHADEIGYLFSVNVFELLYDDYTNDTIVMNNLERLPRYWTNFAKTGTPTPQVDELLPEIWEPFTVDQHIYMELGDEPKLKTGLKSDQMKFWNDLYELGQQRRPLPE